MKRGHIRHSKTAMITFNATCKNRCMGVLREIALSKTCRFMFCLTNRPAGDDVFSHSSWVWPEKTMVQKNRALLLFLVHRGSCVDIGTLQVMVTLLDSLQMEQFSQWDVWFDFCHVESVIEHASFAWGPLAFLQSRLTGCVSRAWKRRKAFCLYLFSICLICCSNPVKGANRELLACMSSLVFFESNTFFSSVFFSSSSLILQLLCVPTSETGQCGV